jgi:hypothetical protein
MRNLVYTLVLLVSGTIPRATAGGNDAIHFVDLRAGVGAVTAPAVMESIGTAVAEAIVDPDFQSVNIDGDIAYSVSALFLPESRFSVGMDMVFDRATLLYEFATKPNESYATDYLTFLARLDFKYLKKGPVKIYSSLGAGFCSRSVDRTQPIADISDNSFGGAIQITPIGARVGNNIAAWAEIGFGFRGILSGGVAFRL